MIPVVSYIYIYIYIELARFSCLQSKLVSDASQFPQGFAAADAALRWTANLLSWKNVGLG